MWKWAKLGCSEIRPSLFFRKCFTTNIIRRASFSSSPSFLFIFSFQFFSLSPLLLQIPLILPLPLVSPLFLLCPLLFLFFFLPPSSSVHEGEGLLCWADSVTKPEIEPYVVIWLSINRTPKEYIYSCLSEKINKKIIDTCITLLKLKHLKVYNDVHRFKQFSSPQIPIFHFIYLFFW